MTRVLNDAVKLFFFTTLSLKYSNHWANSQILLPHSLPIDAAIAV